MSMATAPPAKSNFAAHREVALRAVRKACRVCQSVQSSLVSEETISKKDNSPVTVGDYAVQALIISELSHAFPDLPFIAEEESKTLSAEKDVLAKVLSAVQTIDGSMTESLLLKSIDKGATVKAKGSLWWTLDPIDGTSGFLRREQYAVALALMQDNEPVLGLLGCPSLPKSMKEPNGATGVIFLAETGIGAWQYTLNDADAPERIAVSENHNAEVAIFTESFVTRGYAKELNEKITGVLHVKAPPLQIDSQCKYAVVARGDSDIYLRLSSLDYEECIWDHAAGVCIVREAGGVVTDFLGKKLDFSVGRTLCKNKGIVCVNKALYETTMAGIREVNPLDLYTPK